ncbi:basic amino acid ABC transporter substrate-binding protein [Lachnospiraceae bacterium NSJ-143]|nr:basic amino acid ABC transporter substrate-binding protein [Lachnospiraceae bacterium NSJ-143]
MKKLVLLVAAAFMCASLAACGSSSNSSSSAAASGSASAGASASASGSTEADEPSTTDGGTLTMGTNAAFPPYEYYENDHVVGIDAEIAQAVAEKLGMELKIEDMDFSSLITAVQTGKIDMVLAGMTVTEDRLKNVSFSDSYATGIQSIIVAEDSEIASPDDLQGHMIGVQESTTGHIYCSDDYGEDSVVAYTTGANAVEALKTGKVDAVVIDNEPAKAFVAANEGLKLLDTEYVTEDYAIAIAKDNTELLDKINNALKELKEDGSLDEIIGEYIKAE